MVMNAPILILHGSKQPYLSIGRLYGCIKAFGHEYTYLQPQDAFIRKDYVREFNRFKSSGKTFESFVEFVKSIGNS